VIMALKAELLCRSSPSQRISRTGAEVALLKKRRKLTEALLEYSHRKADREVMRNGEIRL
jgi:hypothetical protein